MAKTIDELKAQSAEVKNATVVGENTATRVGTLFTDIVEHVEKAEQTLISYTNYSSPIFEFSGSYTDNSITINVLWIFIPGMPWKRVELRETYQFPVSGGEFATTHFLVYNKEDDSVRTTYDGTTISSNETVLLTYNREFSIFSGGVLYDILDQMRNANTRTIVSNHTNKLNIYVDFNSGSHTTNSISITTLWVLRNKNWEEISVNNTFTFPLSGGESYGVHYLLYNFVTKTVRTDYDILNFNENEVVLLYWNSTYKNWEGGLLYDAISSKKIEYTDEQCIARFVAEMNKVAKNIGMNDSIFYEPAGYPNTRNVTTAKDLLKLGIYASGVRQINDAWGKRTATVNVYGTNSRTINMTGLSNAEFEQYYDVLGWKYGEAHEFDTNTWIMVVRSKATSKIYVLAEFDLDNNPLTLDYTQIKSALDYVDNSGQQPSFSHGSICIAELPKETPSLFSGVDVPLLYSYNPTLEFVQPSTTKVMTLLTALTVNMDETERVKLKSSDIKTGSGTSIAAGDILTIKDLFLCGMVSSSNTAMYALARIVGNKLLVNDNSIL